MKKIFFLFIVAAGFSACTGNPEKDQVSDSSAISTTADTVSESQIFCFQRLGGTSNQDTAKLRLNIEGAKVSGDFENRPFEKDARVGRVEGMKEGNLIKGIWVFAQEGINDTLPIEFKLTEEKLTQKNYTVDPKTGREVFSEGSVFNLEFNQVDCN